jgi:hypothetical protein
MLAVAMPVFGAVCTVTNTSDSGAGSLRGCIASAASGDTINFSLASPATITLTTGVLTAAVCTIAAGSTKGSTTGLSIAFAAGDLLDIKAGGKSTNESVSIALAVTP